MFTHEEIDTYLDIMKLVSKSDISIVDWGDDEIEIKYPDGTRERVSQIEAVEIIAEEINY